MSSLLVFNRLEIQAVMLVFSTQLCPFNLLSGSTLPLSNPLPCVNKYAGIHVYIQGWNYPTFPMLQLSYLSNSAGCTVYTTFPMMRKTPHIPHLHTPTFPMLQLSYLSNSAGCTVYTTLPMMQKPHLFPISSKLWVLNFPKMMQLPQLWPSQYCKYPAFPTLWIPWLKPPIFRLSPFKHCQFLTFPMLKVPHLSNDARLTSLLSSNSHIEFWVKSSTTFRCRKYLALTFQCCKYEYTAFSMLQNSHLWPQPFIFRLSPFSSCELPTFPKFQVPLIYNTASSHPSLPLQWCKKPIISPIFRLLPFPCCEFPAFPNAGSFQWCKTQLLPHL